MRGLIRLIYRYHVLLLFILLQAVSFFFIFNYNRYHKVLFLNSADVVTGGLYKQRAQLARFITLGDVNDSLVEANQELRNRELKNYIKLGDDLLEVNDTLYKQRYEQRSARVINASINRQQNFITLNKGSELGIEKESAVVCENVLVGSVLDVSQHFAVVMPIINTRFKLSVQVRGELAQLSWNGSSPTHANVSEIPRHLTLQAGDSIFTSGFSKYYPNNILIGTVSEVTSGSEEVLQTALIDLAANYRSLSYVDVINNLMKDEQMELENRIEEDYGEDNP